MPDKINQDIAISGEGNIVVGKGNVIINPLPPAEARLRHALSILLNNVETTWIKGVLEKSVYEATLLELGMELREESVDNPWRMIIEGPDQPREVLPRRRKIKDIFDEANRFLLILGEPGSGKTTTLLQLARDLIAEVGKEFDQPVPVVLNLSTWTNKQQSLDDWLVAELNSKYRLPKRDGQRWLEERRILPLLDGLDEVKADNRAACVEKINELVAKHGFQGMVVCSRIKEYTDLGLRLAFYRAIHIQPLSVEQIEKYLDQAGDKLTSLRLILQDDPALLSMAKSPLILNIMSLAYRNSPAESFRHPALASNKARRQHLFETYITRMLSRRAGKRISTDEQSKDYLSWLAQKMQQHNQEVFLIEGLQPSWLPTRRWQWVYIFASRLISVLSVGLSLWQLLLPLLVAGLFVGLIDILRFEWLRKHKGMRNMPTVWWSLMNIAAVYLVFGLSFSLWGGTLSGLFGVLMFGLFFGSWGSQQSLENDIQTVEALRWSWRKALRGGFIVGLISGLLGGLAFVLILWELDDSTRDTVIAAMGGGLISVLSAGLIFGLIFGLLGAIFNGLTSEIIETKSSPNQGIRLSIRNAVFVGLMGGLIVWSTLGLRVVEGALDYSLLVAVGLMAVLWYGGFDVIRHYVLRLILVIQGHTPHNYVRFLDHVADLIFLQKAGAGYRFIHRLLLEHFAEMYETRKA